MLPFRWAEEQTGSRHGEGISRPMAKARTKTFTLKVRPIGQSQFTWKMAAETKARAIDYALARWPGAAVEVA